MSMLPHAIAIATFAHNLRHRSDKKENVYVVTERYRSKEDYLHAHRSSPAFVAFRPVMRRMQDSGDVVVSGDSFVELGLGFT